MHFSVSMTSELFKLLNRKLPLLCYPAAIYLSLLPLSTGPRVYTPNSTLVITSKQHQPLPLPGESHLGPYLTGFTRGSSQEWFLFLFSRSVVSDSLRPHESQHTRPSCPSPTPEFTQTHVHWVSDAIQPSHPLSSPSPPAPNPSQHQGLFQWVSSSHEVAKVLEFQL